MVRKIQDINKLSKKQLQDICKKNNYSNYSQLNKSELKLFIENNGNKNLKQKEIVKNYSQKVSYSNIQNRKRLNKNLKSNFAEINKDDGNSGLIGYTTNATGLTTSVEITLDNLEDYLSDPFGNYQDLQSVADVLGVQNGLYKTVLRHFTNMFEIHTAINFDLYAFDQNSLNIEELHKEYVLVEKELKKISRQGLENIGKIIISKGFYTGLRENTHNGYTFTELPFESVKFKDTDDGVLNGVFYLPYLDNYYNEDYKNEETQDYAEFNSYPEIIKDAYESYYNNGQLEKEEYFDLPPEDFIAIPLDWQRLYPLPFLAHIFEDILYINDYKDLDLENATQNNAKGVALEMPLVEGTQNIDMFRINQDSMIDIVAAANATMEDAGLNAFAFSYPKSITPIDFSNSADTNNTEQAVKTLYANSGINNSIFTASTQWSVTYAMQNDANLIFGIYRDIEKWLNRRLKILGYNKENDDNSEYSFNAKILDVTSYMLYKKDYVSELMKQINLSIPTALNDLLALNDVSLSNNKGMGFIMKDVFNIYESWQQMTTVNTNSTSNTGSVASSNIESTENTTENTTETSNTEDVEVDQSNGGDTDET